MQESGHFGRQLARCQRNEKIARQSCHNSTYALTALLPVIGLSKTSAIVAGVSLLGLLATVALLPEPKGASLEDLTEDRFPSSAVALGVAESSGTRPPAAGANPARLCHGLNRRPLPLGQFGFIPNGGASTGHVPAGPRRAASRTMDAAHGLAGQG
jgi:hypothetical protein